MIKRRLSNGLRVIYFKKPGRKVALSAIVGAGFAYECKGQRGISHFVEHMLFEGTQKRKSCSFIMDEAYQKGDINGCTCGEYTEYDVCMYNQNFEEAVDLLSDILQNPVFDEKSIQKEKRVVLNELRMHEADDHYKVHKVFLKSLFPKLKYSQSPSEYREDMKKLTRKKIINFYNKYYMPNNMVLSIVGDVKNPFDVIEKKFVKRSGKLPKRPVLKTRSPNKATQKKVSSKSKTAHILVGFRTPDVYHRDIPTVKVVSELLRRKLSDEIRFKRGLTYHLGVMSSGAIGLSHMLIYTNVEKKHTKKVISLIMERIGDLKKTTEKELKEVKHRLVLDNTEEYEHPEYVASELSSNEFLKTHDLKTLLKKIKQVNLRDVTRFSDCYLKNHVLTTT